MARGEIHLNDIGTIFEVIVKDQDDNVVDISSATGAHAKLIIFKKPDATKVEKDTIFSTDGKDGKMRYVTVDGDLNLLGDWEYQGKVILTAGTWSSDIYTFRVYRNL